MTEEDTVRSNDLGPLRNPEEAKVEYETNPGLWVRLKVSGEETGGAYEVWQMDVGKGVSIGLHEHHKHFETFILLKGSMEVRLENGDKFVAKAGSVVQFPPNLPHDPITLEPITAITINSPGDNIRFLEAMSKLTPEQREDKEYMKELCASFDEYILQ